MKVFYTFLCAILLTLFLTSNFNAQPTDGLVAYYPFNGNANDESGNNNHGTVFGSTLTDGRYGSAYSFDGTNDYIEIPDDPSLRPNNITIAAWVSPEELNSQFFSCIVGKSNFSSGAGEQYYLMVKSEGFQMGIKRNSNCTNAIGWNGVFATNQIPLNQWTNLISTWDGIWYKQYINGVKVVESNSLTSGNIDNCPGGELKIGRWWDFDPSYFKGKIDEVLIYNRALTESEILIVVEVEKEEYILPSDYYLFQNYPNPFNPTTKIQFSIPERSFVELKIYNLLGEVISNLVNEELDIGTYTATFDGASLSSGIYFYKLTVGNFKEIKSMVLSK